MYLQNPCAFAGVFQPANGALTITVANGALVIRCMPASHAAHTSIRPGVMGRGHSNLALLKGKALLLDFKSCGCQAAVLSTPGH